MLYRPGLKNALQKAKGSGVRFKIKNLAWELRYAWQRAWQGYDSSNVFELGYNFANRMPFLLREFQKHNIALFTNPQSGVPFTAAETNRILEEMIFYFENCDEDFVYNRLFGGEFGARDLSLKRWNAVHQEMERCQTKAIQLFSQYVWQLWY